ncbi:hypothetical protein [Nitratifractor salsuginis]|uniref:Lipoprotein n=1 Tax=Nitratifractor salsuginis (strain DSM 16511 / JCM 12458 / E9I37-1) TaxID=749222 RepID=E6WZ76_NITSE|nr:hypothetical protein [Nitratifractor salsuginis]ADV46588.1 hypothetical protein Nitsa_1337 [Nitratifractor salsuginis DSM 16511]
MLQRNIMLSMAAVSVLILSGCGGGGSGARKSAPVESGNSGVGINANGGSGEIAGSKGGSIEIDSGVNLKITKSGKVDTTFEVPTHTPDFGQIPAEISADTVIPIRDSNDSHLIGVPFYSQDTKLMVNVGEDADTSNDRNATGLRIDHGVTVLAEGDDSTRYSFVSDVVIDGVLKVVRQEEDEAGKLVAENRPANLSITTEGGWIIISEEGKIDLGSHDVSDPQESGHLDLYIEDQETADTDNNEQRALVIAGTIDARGKHGGRQADIYLNTENQAAIYITQTARLQADALNGYDGGDIHITSYGGLYTAGTISANGGDMADDDAGDGGRIYLSDRDGFPFILAGKITANGGKYLREDVSDAPGTLGKRPDLRRGGDGGSIALGFRSENDFKGFATVEAEGGDAPEGQAGRGGELRIDIHAIGDKKEIAQLGGPLSVNGGDGRIGGDGGELSIELSYENRDDPSAVPDVLLKGYTYIAANGGAGTDVAGRIGDDHGEIDFDFGNKSDVPQVFVNEADLYLYGADANEAEDQEDFSGAKGGNGGWLYLYADVAMTVTNSGNIYLYGGDSWGDANNSDGGTLTYCFHEDVDGNFTSNVDVTLSPGTGGSGAPGSAGRIVNECDG